MRGKTHCAIGVLAAIQTSLLFKIPLSFFNIFICSFFSILPDLDEPNSIISTFFFKKETSKFIYKLLIYSLNIIIFIISIKINNNFIVSAIFTFLSIIFIEKKLTHNLLRKFFLSLIFLLLGFCLYLLKVKMYFVYFTVLLSIFPWVKHRTFSHSLFACLILFFILRQIEITLHIPYLSVFGTTGFLSHIILGDLFTRQGVPLFYPLSNKKFSFGNLKVGGSFSNILEILFIVCFMIIIIYTLVKFG